MITAVVIYGVGFAVAYLLFWHKFLLIFAKLERKVNFLTIFQLALLFGALSWFAVLMFLIDEIIDFITNIKK
jgi:hypothetical protein